MSSGGWVFAGGILVCLSAAEAVAREIGVNLAEAIQCIAESYRDARRAARAAYEAEVHAKVAVLDREWARLLERMTSKQAAAQKELSRLNTDLSSSARRAKERKLPVARPISVTLEAVQVLSAASPPCTTAAFQELAVKSRDARDLATRLARAASSPRGELAPKQAAQMDERIRSLGKASREYAKASAKSERRFHDEARRLAIARVGVLALGTMAAHLGPAAAAVGREELGMTRRDAETQLRRAQRSLAGGDIDAAVELVGNLPERIEAAQKRALGTVVRAAGVSRRARPAQKVAPQIATDGSGRIVRPDKAISPARTPVEYVERYRQTVAAWDTEVETSRAARSRRAREKQR